MMQPMAPPSAEYMEAPTAQPLMQAPLAQQPQYPPLPTYTQPPPHVQAVRASSLEHSAWPEGQPTRASRRVTAASRPAARQSAAPAMQQGLRDGGGAVCAGVPPPAGPAVPVARRDARAFAHDGG